MTTHSETRIVPVPAERMYTAVAGVEAYPKFLPWVTSTRILGREQVKGREVLTAEMTVGFSRFTERYTSRVVLDPAGLGIDVAQIEGPFRILENHWKFLPMGEACKVDFSIVFEFKSLLLNLAAGAAFERVSRRMADAFEQRARARPA